MLKKAFAAILICFLHLYCFSTTSKTFQIDSLTSLLNKSKEDYTKTALLLKISEEYKSLPYPKFDSAIVYASSAMNKAISTGNIKWIKAANNAVQTSYLLKINTFLNNSKNLALADAKAKEQEENTEAKERRDAKVNQDIIELLKKKEVEHNQTIFYFIFIIFLILSLSFVFLLNRFFVINKQKKIIAIQRNEVVEKNKQITESIEYAHRIQKSTLPSQKSIRDNFKNSFVFFKPKDILSGDFYWFHTQEDESIIVCADCTGHGVPGAFISMVGCTLLNEIVRHKKIWDPAQIINELSIGLLSIFGNKEKEVINMDGMDISICKLSGDKVFFAAVNNSLLIVNDKGILEVEPQVKSIHGIFKIDASQKFESIELTPEKGSMLYLSTDGFADQIGEVTRKKLYASGFQKLLLEIYNHPLEEQKDKLESFFHLWRGNLNQRDDVLVMGGRV